MIKISNSILISLFTKLLVLLVIAKVISLVAWWYLPDDGVELNNLPTGKTRFLSRSEYSALFGFLKEVEKKNREIGKK